MPSLKPKCSCPARSPGSVPPRCSNIDRQAVLRGKRPLLLHRDQKVIRVVGGDGQDSVHGGLIRAANNPMSRVAVGSDIAKGGCHQLRAGQEAVSLVKGLQVLGYLRGAEARESRSGETEVDPLGLQVLRIVPPFAWRAALKRRLKSATSLVVASRGISSFSHWRARSWLGGRLGIWAGKPKKTKT